MDITDVRVRKINKEGRMKAIVSITLNDQLVIHDVRIIEGNNGLFVAMPSKKTPSGDFKDIAHPINSEARAYIEKKVIDAYQTELVEELEEGEEIEKVEEGEEYEEMT